MPVLLRGVLLVLTILYLFFVLKKVRHRNIHVRLSILWIALGIVLLIGIAFPNLVTTISNQLGFETPSNMVFLIAVFLCFYLIFNLTTILSKEQRTNAILIQEVSILKNKLEKGEEKNET